MASFPKEKSRYHRVIFYSKGRSKSFYFKKSDFRRGDISRWKKERELEFAAGKWSPWNDPDKMKTDVTLQQVIDSYKKTASRQLTESTLTANVNYMNDFMNSAGNNFPVSEQKINGWINGGDVKYLTRKKRKSCVNALLRHAKDRMKVIDELPQLEVISTRAERSTHKEKDWLNSDELEELIQNLHALDKKIKNTKLAHGNNAKKYNRLRPDLELLFRLVHKTGMRLGDVHNFSLDWIESDPSMKGKRIIRFKNYTPKSQRLNEVIPVMPEIVEVVDRLEKKYPFKEMSKEWISKTFKKCVPKGKKMSFRNLRDSAANYWLYERKLPVTIVQQILRHADIKTTMIYVHDNLEEVQKYVWDEK